MDISLSKVFRHVKPAVWLVAGEGGNSLIIRGMGVGGGGPRVNDPTCIGLAVVECRGYRTSGEKGGGGKVKGRGVMW